MMKQMRENTKVILWIVVFAFVVTIFAVWGLDLQTGTAPVQGQSIGRVNGVTVTPQLYQSVYNQFVQQYRASSPDRQLTYAQQEMMQDQAWESIVNNILTTEQIEKLGIRVTDQEILAFLRTSPPPEVQQYFTDENGRFDYAAYQAALNNPEADWTAVEQLARERIPLMKLNQYLMAQVHVSDAEVRRAFDEANTRLTVRYVRFPIAAEDIGDYEPGDDEIEEYYATHPDEFSDPAKAVLNYVRIPIEPTARDMDDIRFTIETIHRQLEDGEPFDVMARTYSEGYTANVGGDVGFIRREQRPEPVMAAVDTLEPGEFSSPVETSDGMYIVKLEETRDQDGNTEYHLREIQLDLSAGSVTIDSLISVAQEVQRVAAESGSDLDKGAAASGLEVETTAPFPEGGLVSELGFVPSLSRFAFANDEGTLSNVINDDDNYYVCKVMQRIPESTRNLDDDLRAQISRTLVTDRKRAAAERKANGFHLKLRASDLSMSESAEQYGVAVSRADSFTVDQPVAGMPPRSPFAYAAFDAKTGAIPPPVESVGAFYVLEVLHREPFDAELYATQAPQIERQLFTRKSEEYIAYWYEQLRSKAEIEDYRGAL